MLKVKQSKKFKKDYAQYRRNLDKITNDQARKNGYELLNKLVEQFNLIDAVHETTNTSIDPTKIRENVETSVQLRRRLNKLIKESQYP